jgi:hypothetical protein
MLRAESEAANGRDMLADEAARIRRQIAKARAQLTPHSPRHYSLGCAETQDKTAQIMRHCARMLARNAVVIFSEYV